MTHTLTVPSPSASLRRLAARALADPDSRSVLIGILAVLLVHFLLFATAPYLLRTEPIHMTARRQAVPQQFSIEIAPDAFVKPVSKPPPPNKYVEANPNARTMSRTRRTTLAPRTSSSPRRSRSWTSTTTSRRPRGRRISNRTRS